MSRLKNFGRQKGDKWKYKYGRLEWPVNLAIPTTCIMLKLLGATVQNSATRATRGWDASSTADYNCYENSYKTELQALLFWRRSRTHTLGPALSLPSVADEKAFLTADEHSHWPTCHPTALWMHQIPKSLARIQLQAAVSTSQYILPIRFITLSQLQKKKKSSAHHSGNNSSRAIPPPPPTSYPMDTKGPFVRGKVFGI